jgi:hypothetical protein
LTVKSSQGNTSKSYGPALVAFLMTINLWIFLYLLFQIKLCCLDAIEQHTYEYGVKGKGKAIP